MMKENETNKNVENPNRRRNSQSEIATLKLEYYKCWNKLLKRDPTIQRGSWGELLTTQQMASR